MRSPNFKRISGAAFVNLSEAERLALVTAATEGVLSHPRFREICTDHPSDITKMLGRLVKDGLLVSSGVGRGMVYFLPWQDRSGAQLFATENAPLPQGLAPVSPELSSQPPQPVPQPPQLDTSRQTLLTVYLDWEQLSESAQHELTERARPVSQQARTAPAVLHAVIFDFCRNRFLGRRVLARALNRNPDDLLKRALNPLVDEGRLKTAFPSKSDPRQAYTTVDPSQPTSNP